jgi:putative flippase GtrA
LLHEYWTFKGRRPSVRSLLTWLGAQIGSVVLSLGMLALLVAVVGLGPITAQALLLPFAPLLAYLLGRSWIFTRP